MTSLGMPNDIHKAKNAGIMSSYGGRFLHLQFTCSELEPNYSMNIEEVQALTLEFARRVGFEEVEPTEDPKAMFTHKDAPFSAQLRYFVRAPEAPKRVCGIEIHYNANLASNSG